MKKLFIFLCIVFFPPIISGQNITLRKIIETDPQFKTPESVCMNRQNGDIYVSNINGSPAQKDGNGFISIIDRKGNIKQLQWIKGLNAPKGCDIDGDTLFVTDIDHLVLINWKTAEVIRKIFVKDAAFLNDVATAPHLGIFFSDSDDKHSVIYRYLHGKITEFLKKPTVNRPNGLLYSKGKLFIGNSGTGEILQVNPSNGHLEKKITVGRGIDGLKIIPGASFLTSDWSGRITLTTFSEKTFDLIDTRKQKINAADFEFLPDQQLLLVPTFFANTITIYKLEPVTDSINLTK